LYKKGSEERQKGNEERDDGVIKIKASRKRSIKEIIEGWK
jgi:hypothetical protein